MPESYSKKEEERIWAIKAEKIRTNIASNMTKQKTQKTMQKRKNSKKHTNN